MKIIPAIDLFDGKVVRLRQGDFTAATYYQVSAHDMLQEYQRAGFSRVHIVDLSGAQAGMMQQERILQQLCAATQLKIQIGGGIRTTQQIESLFAAGVDRVVIGSLAVTNSTQVEQWLTTFGGEKMVIALDVTLENATPYVMTEGWQQNSQVTLAELLSRYPANSIKQVLCTDIARDGLLSGPNIDLYQNLMRDYANINWLASGGVASLKDLQALKNIGMRAVIIGKALYENRLTLSQCMEAEQW